MRAINITRQIFIFIFILGIFSNSIAFAQKAKGTATAQNKSASTPKCSGAWTGVVRYSRTQSQTDNKTVERVSGRGKDTRNWEMKYDYKAQAAVTEAPEKNGSSVAKATIRFLRSKRSLRWKRIPATAAKAGRK